MKTKDYGIIDFSSRLTLLMHENKYNQTTLAKRIGVGRKTILAWENGCSTPNTSMLKKLYFVLHSNADYLIGLSNERVSPVDNRNIELMYKEMMEAEKIRNGNRRY